MAHAAESPRLIDVAASKLCDNWWRQRLTYFLLFFDAAILDMVLQTLPRIAAEVSAPLSQCQKVTMVSTGEGEVGISKISNEVMKVVESLPALVTSVTGQDMRSFITAK
ncbi:unnamed protein product [Dibothriocephalus latus]|uniref:Flotillin C-terminal domain-containing protein n=1 Tax=Dibothriocephalus latus TaxID=60516 RepID=A0A3P7LQ96_DIBLA|nr:unnamed protein product [Dibothriocephalus latus]